MKLAHAILLSTWWFVASSSSLGQVFTVYDNGISSVNNGRVNDLNYPVFLMNADNFSLPADQLINQVDWLGGYKNGDMLPDADDGFTIRFFAFSGDTPATTAFATFQVGAVVRQLTSQTLSYGNPIFSYSAQIPVASLPAGTYLMSIMNSHAGSKQWMWADADSAPGDSYMMLFEGSPWREFSGSGVAEFAFSISYVPEPSGAVLMLLGGLLFGVLRLRPCSRKNG
jgi:hypothetical protein